MEPISPYGLTADEYAKIAVERLGRGRLHALSLYSELMRDGVMRGDSAAFNTAGKLKEQLFAMTDLTLMESTEELVEEQTRKFLLRTHDGYSIESVVIPMPAGPTLCISSQVGCAMGCAFCETARMGLKRSLTASEIVQQLFFARHHLKVPIRSVVFMGMGEPLDNFEAVMQAVRVMIDERGLALGASHISISTSGLVPQIYRLIEEGPSSLNLAVSVNAPTDEIRRRIMPVNNRYSMGELKQAMAAYCKTGRSLFIEYVLLEGVNDSIEAADALLHYLDGLDMRINVIPYNSQRRTRFAPPAPEVIERFAAHLRAKGALTLLRTTRGRSIMAACGQLGNRANMTRLLESNF